MARANQVDELLDTLSDLDADHVAGELQEFDANDIVSALARRSLDGGGGGSVPIVIDLSGQGGANPPIRAIADDPDNFFQYGGEGRLTVGINDTTAGLAILANNDSRQLYLFEGDDPAYIQTGDGTEAVFIRADSFTELRPVVIQVSAPADAALSAGQCSIWFDQTNGAAKLKIVAKTADGTVAHGEVNLT